MGGVTALMCLQLPAPPQVEDPEDQDPEDQDPEHQGPQDQVVVACSSAAHRSAVKQRRRLGSIVDRCWVGVCTRARVSLHEDRPAGVDVVHGHIWLSLGGSARGAAGWCLNLAKRNNDRVLFELRHGVG